MKKQEKTQQEIVEAEIKARGQGNDWRVAYLMISRLINKPDWRLFRSNDTIFLMHNYRDPEKTVEFYIYNGDTEKELKGNLKDFFKALKISGFKVALFKPVGAHTAQTIRNVSDKTSESNGKIRVQL